MAKTEYGTTWWGKKWLESLSGIDEENRIPRGKSYANTGKVLSLKIDENKHQIKAKVQGHYDPFYRVTIEVPAITKVQASKLMDAIANSPLLVAKLSARELDPAILDECDKLGIKLFPKSWSDFSMRCSCPDWAVPCKHLAAVIYKISQEIDANPFVLFKLRGLDLIAEMEKRGVSIERAQKAELPSWLEILNDFKPFRKSASTKSDFYPDLYSLTFAERQKWIKELRRLAFSKIEFSTSALMDLLPEQPAGYVFGDLRKKMQEVVKNAGKLATLQLTDKWEREVPTFSPETPMVCVNSFGLAVPNETLEFKVYEPGATQPMSVHIGSRINDRTIGFHQMFSGFIKAKDLLAYSEQMEAFYSAWMIASKLMAAEAVMPRIYEPLPDCFAIQWIPAVSDSAIAKLTESVGRLFSFMDLGYLEILRRPKNISPLIMGEIILGMFIQAYIRNAFELKKVKLAYDSIDDQALFGGGYIDSDDNPEAQATRLRLTAWLEPLNSGNRHNRTLIPVVTVHDHLSGEKASSHKEAFERPVGLEFGFDVLEEGDDRDKVYVPLDEIIEEPEWKDYRFDALRTVAQLSNYCPELADLLKDSAAQKDLTMELLTPLMFKALPSLRLLGAEVILPRALQKLLTPEVSVAMDLDDEWEEGMGFMSLMNLLTFDWKVALGNKGITGSEFKQICQKAGNIVYFHDSYVYVDPQQIKSINNKLSRKNAGFSQMALIRGALSGEIEKTGVILSERLKATLEKMFSEKHFDLPKHLHANLRPYQERGYNWMMRNIGIGLGSILADDMGLGKTLQVLTVLDKLRERGDLDKKPALIVVPTTLLTNWLREAAKFTPELRMGLYYGTQRTDDFKGLHGILTTYGTLRSSVNVLKKHPFKLVVIDEAQAIKNHKTSGFKAVKALNTDTAIAMSGTPVENRLMEYWSIMEATNPGILGTATTFQREIAKPIESNFDIDKAEQFKRMTAPFIMRRMKTDKSIISDLPEKISSDEFCTLTKEQVALYKAVVEKNLKLLESQPGQAERRAMVLKMIIQLKQICNAPVQFEPKSQFNRPEDSGKMLRTFDLLDELIAADRKILIFTQFRQMGEKLREWIGEHLGRKPEFIHGGLPVKARQEIVDRFQTVRNDKVLILSLKAAGTGLNLTAASAIIHYDLWWNPAVEAQATDRAFRIGQKNNVNVYRLISANTFEEKINEMIESKKKLANMTVATGESWIGDLSDRELKELFSMEQN